MVNKIKRKHILLPNCPRCNSNMVGRYLAGAPVYEAKETERYYKKGERVRFSQTINVPYHNLYCEACGNEWRGNPQSIKCTNEEWNNICQNNLVLYDKLAYQYALHCDKEIEKHKKELRKERVKNVIRGTVFFFFGIKLPVKERED